MPDEDFVAASDLLADDADVDVGQEERVAVAVALATAVPRATLHLRKVCNTQAVACALLGGSLRGQMLLAGMLWQVTMAPSLARLARPAVRFLLEWEGIRCRASLSTTGVETLFAPLLGAIPLDQVGEPLLLALMQDLLDSAASAWQVSRAEPVRMLALAADEDSFPVLFEVRLSPQQGGDAVVLSLEVEAEGVMRLADRAAAMPAAKRVDLRAWATLPVPLRLEVGWVDLPLGQLKSLRTQDILLMDGTWRSAQAEQKNHACLRLTPCHGVLVSLDSQIGMTALDNMSNMEQEPLMTSSDALNDNEFMPPELAELTVRISFDLGERKLPLRDLSAIEAGYVFDLALPATRAVNLRVNGVRVGEGELVEIDGRIGVAVTRFTPPV
ncbi:MAG: type III secretion system cytoplasmic ring protein SctQ [Pseudomonadota bacterium]